MAISRGLCLIKWPSSLKFAIFLEFKNPGTFFTFYFIIFLIIVLVYMDQNKKKKKIKEIIKNYFGFCNPNSKNMANFEVFRQVI